MSHCERLALQDLLCPGIYSAREIISLNAAQFPRAIRKSGRWRALIKTKSSGRNSNSTALPAPLSNVRRMPASELCKNHRREWTFQTIQKSPIYIRHPRASSSSSSEKLAHVLEEPPHRLPEHPPRIASPSSKSPRHIVARHFRIQRQVVQKRRWKNPARPWTGARAITKRSGVPGEGRYTS